MPDLILQRAQHDENATLGELLFQGERVAFTLENRPPKTAGVKERGVSRIPAGRYALGTRYLGGFYEDYTHRWGWHGPMIEIDLPGWDAVLFHIGNYHTNTAGCVLLGSAAGESEHGLSVWRSTEAYMRAYPTLLSVAQSGGCLIVKNEGEG